MATTTATNSSQASPSPFPASLLAGFQQRNFQANNNSSASPSSTPISSTSTTSSTLNSSGVFPSGVLNPHMAGFLNPNYCAAFMQSQLMQYMKQCMAGMSGGDSNGHTNGDSRSSSTAASPSFGNQQQQHQKKLLPLDADGNISCPICQQKVGPDSGSSHLELERSNLIKFIESIKENKRPSASSGNNTRQGKFFSELRRKREFELARIRSNQQKRLSMKGSLMSGSLPVHQNTMRPSSKFMVGSLCDQMSTPPRSTSGMSIRNGEVEEEKNFCKSCKRIHEFLIISNGLEPRCMDCYRKYRRQVGALPLTITESPTEDRAQQPGHRNGSHTTSSASPPSGAHEEEDDLFGSNENPLIIDEDKEAGEVSAKRPRMNFVSDA